MFSAILVSMVCFGLEPSAAIPPKVDAGVTAAYEAARAKAGRNADAHVQLALWCEAHDMKAERLKHLAIVVLANPAHTTARGLMGLVAFDGRWRSPGEVSAHVESDADYSAALAAYGLRRTRTVDTADSQWKLALYCEENGLKAESTAHLRRVVQLDSGRESAWKRLGYRKRRGRWLIAEQIAAESAETEAQKEADKRWPPILARWRRWIGDKGREAELAQALATVADRRAVPSVWMTFGRGSPAHQMAAVQILGQIDSADSTHALALLALNGRSLEVRARATQTLRLRDPRDIAAFLVALLRDPQLDPDPILFHYELTPVAWNSINEPGILRLSGPLYDLVRTYTIDESGLVSPPPDTPDIQPMVNFAARLRQQRMSQILDLARLIDEIRADTADYVLFAREHVRQVDEANARVVGMLNSATRRNGGNDRESWRKWWTEERGYAYEPPPMQPRQDLTLGDSKPTYYNTSHLSCFAAGTIVRTLSGARPIESIAIGDQVLTQDTRTGALGYAPVIDAPHNRPDKVLRIEIGGDSIKATPIHRFWKAGLGWVAARDLRPGDVIRALDGVATVQSIVQAGSEPVFNLKVLGSDNYFAGASSLLVHDHSEVAPVVRGFDAVPDLRPVR